MYGIFKPTVSVRIDENGEGMRHAFLFPFAQNYFCMIWEALGVPANTWNLNIVLYDQSFLHIKQTDRHRNISSSQMYVKTRASLVSFAVCDSGGEPAGPH